MNLATAARALELLRDAYGEDAEFRDDQLDAILALVDQRSRVLVVQRTGWGKSVVYFIATALRREQGLGPTLLISPLLALMRDQLRMAATTFGLLADRIDSSNRDRHGEIEAVPAEVLPGAVLLVDDMVDSRWSLTVCGVALRRAGAGPVYPVTLSQTTSGS